MAVYILRDIPKKDIPSRISSSANQNVRLQAQNNKEGRTWSNTQ